jgi:predicted AAA+ superfamily ATPase
VTILGPRQAGKTTLVKAIFPDHEYINLESPETRSIAEKDPRSLLQDGRVNVVLDEMLVKGFLPRLYDAPFEPQELYSAYFATYVERDVRRLIHVRDRGRFGIPFSEAFTRTWSS